MCAGAIACALALKLAHSHSLACALERVLAHALARAIARADARSVERAVVRAREYIFLFQNGGHFLFCYHPCTHTRPDTRPYVTNHSFRLLVMTDGLTDLRTDKVVYSRRFTTKNDT